MLVLPTEEADWLSQTVEELVLRHCAYWISLKGRPPTKARSTQRPWPEQSPGQVCCCWELFVLGEDGEEEEEEEEEEEAASTGRHRLLASPALPTKAADRQGPQVCSVL